MYHAFLVGHQRMKLEMVDFEFGDLTNFELCFLQLERDFSVCITHLELVIVIY